MSKPTESESVELPPTHAERRDQRDIVRGWQAEKSGKPTDYVEKLLRQKRKGVPHLSEVIEHIIEKFGGADAFAQAFFDTYLHAKPGSITRGQTLNKVVEMMKIHQQTSGPAEDPLEGVSEEDLINYLKQFDDK